MTKNQRTAVTNFMCDRISAVELSQSLGFDFQTEHGRVVALLDDAAVSGVPEDVECALDVAIAAKLNEDILVPLLIRLLEIPSHERHEDLARLLQDFKDERAIDALHRTTLREHEYLSYDENFGLARKCTWALADIGTPAALEKLQRLASCDNPTIARYAQKRIDCWSAERHRKGRNR